MLNPLQEQLALALAKVEEQAAQIAALTAPPPVREKPAIKAYFSSLPFIKVPIMRAPGFCDSVQFIAGKLETDDPAVIAVLDKMCATPGTGFGHGVVEEAPELSEMRADIRNLAEVAHAKMVAAGEKTA